MTYAPKIVDLRSNTKHVVEDQNQQNHHHIRHEGFGELENSYLQNLWKPLNRLSR